MMEWNKAIREYKKLRVPKEYYNPCLVPLEQSKYNVIVTERATGKTTNILLLGLICHCLFGTQVQYIRQYDEMLAPKHAKSLFEVIETCGYIPKITRKKYNSIVYKARKWYLCHRDEDGNITDLEDKPCVSCLSIDNHDTYKSSYNAPTGDYIIFDEFCARRHSPDEFFSFCDILSTIIRSRTEPIVWMLGNTLDRYEYYFDELEISDYIKYMQLGESMLVSTSKGTPIYIELYAGEKTKKEKSNKLYFGFKNTKLNAITGDDWLIVPYQHADGKDDTREIIARNHYIQYEQHTIQIDICTSEKYGLHIIMHKCKGCDFDDAIIYTCNDQNDTRKRYRFGHSKTDRMIWTLYERKKCYFATNTDAAIADKYYQLARQL